MSKFAFCVCLLGAVSFVVLSSVDAASHWSFKPLTQLKNRGARQANGFYQSQQPEVNGNGQQVLQQFEEEENEEAAGLLAAKRQREQAQRVQAQQEQSQLQGSQGPAPVPSFVPRPALRPAPSFVPAQPAPRPQPQLPTFAPQPQQALRPSQTFRPSAPVPAPRPFPSPSAPSSPVLVEELDSAAPEPYSFSFSVNDEQSDFSLQREESQDANGNVVGFYHIIGPDGRLRRVDYTAGPEGFKAQIKSNEEGVIASEPADAVYSVN